MGVINKLHLLNQVRKNQWLKPSELEELQNKKLRAIVKHAYENTEFYHRKFKDAGVRPEDIRTVNDIHKLPFTTKAEVREHSLGSMLANGVDLNRCIITKTSGSTGIPTNVVYDQNADDFSKAINLRSHMENGLKYRSKWVVFGDPHHFKKPQWFQKLRILSPMQISVFDSADNQASIIKKINPDVIDGYTSSIRLLAQYVKENEIEGIKPNIIFGTSELLDKNTRKIIKSAFDVDILDQFGCVELNRTAWECHEHSGYHIDVDSVVMEFIKDEVSVSPGERGEIIYTGLYNYAMPLIRYKIEDVGIPSDEICPCGRGLPLMKIVEGRSDSFMQVPDGRIFPAMIWEPIMRRIPGVGQFKTIQVKKDLLRILIVKDSNFSENTIPQIQHDVKEVMGPEIGVDVNLVNEITKEKSGKVRSAESKVKIEW